MRGGGATGSGLCGKSCLMLCHTLSKKVSMEFIVKKIEKKCVGEEKQSGFFLCGVNRGAGATLWLINLNTPSHAQHTHLFPSTHTKLHKDDDFKNHVHYKIYFIFMITKHFLWHFVFSPWCLERGTNVTLSKFDKQTFRMNSVTKKRVTQCVNKYSWRHGSECCARLMEKLKDVTGGKSASSRGGVTLGALNWRHTQWAP